MECTVLSLKLGGRITVGIKKENEVMNGIFYRYSEIKTKNEW